MLKKSRVGLKKLLRPAVCAALAAAAMSFNVYAKQDITVLIDGDRMEFDTQPFIQNERVMVPMRTIFEGLGAEVVWYEDTEIITAEMKDKVVTLQIGSGQMLCGDTRVTLEAPPVLAEDRTMVPVRAVSEAFGSTVGWDEQSRTVTITSPVEENETMSGTVISDEYRYKNFDGEYNGVSIFDNAKSDYFGMELLRIPESDGEDYADIVSTMADMLPDCKVYCGIIPTASEFYAAKVYKTNYLSAISDIYNSLSENVIPFNIERIMMENADEYIYFKTDHHWTHLGSYYAYREFCSVSGNIPAVLDEFETETIDGYLGSWGGVTDGTDGYGMLSASRDRIELFLPKVHCEAAAYSDMELENKIRDIELIDLSRKNYEIFIEGDNPAVHIRTDANSGKSVCIIKESYGNAFSTWLVNNYDDIYVIDYRQFNGNSGNDFRFNINDFHRLYPFDELIVLSYPYTVLADDLRECLRGLTENGVSATLDVE